MKDLSNNHLEKKKKSFLVVVGKWLIAAALVVGAAYLLQWITLIKWGKAEELAPTDFLKFGDSAVVFVRERWDILSDPLIIEERFRLRKGPGVFSISQTIRGPQTLKGKVRIASPQAALQYVRLFTSPATAYLMENDNWREIIPASAVNEDYLFSRSKKIFAETEELLKSCNQDMGAIFKIPNYQASHNGYVTSEAWQANHLRAPEVIKTKNGFLVRRELFHVTKYDPISNKICWVEEAITPQGEIKRKILTETESNIDFVIVSSRETY